MAPSNKVTGPAIPLVYRLFFLWIEPFSTAVGAYYAHFSQRVYMTMTAAPLTIPPPPVTITTSIVLTQLANLYFVFALNEALVLRSTNDLTVWRAFLFGLLVADFGHLFSVHQAGVEVYWEFWKWNAMYWVSTKRVKGYPLTVVFGSPLLSDSLLTLHLSTL